MFIDANVKKVFFTSDTHFGHKNVIKYCNRPFTDVEEMDRKLVENWNSVVGKDDVVFHLGDFMFIKEQKTLDNLFESLNGKIYLIPGNHDHNKIIHPSKWFSGNNLGKITVYDSLLDVDFQVEDEKLRFVLCHYALKVWNKSHYGAIHLYGHSHGTLPDDPNARSMDVGVDCNDYTPISLDDVLVKMYRKTFKAVDHHKDTVYAKDKSYYKPYNADD